MGGRQGSGANGELRDALRKVLAELRDTPYLQLQGTGNKDGGLLRMSSLAGLCAREEVLCSRLRRSRTREVEPGLGVIFEHGNGLHWCLQNRLLPAAKFLVGRWLCGGCGYIHGGRETWEAPFRSPEHRRDFESSQLYRPKRCPECDTRLTSENILYQEQYVVDRGRRLGGHPDGFLRMPARVGLGLLEAKSINPRDARAVRACPKLDHVVQIQGYMWLTGCRWGMIIYWDKGGSGMSALIAHFIEYDEDHVEAIENMVLDIWSGVADEDLPLPERICAHIDCNRAELCPVATECFAERD